MLLQLPPELLTEIFRYVDSAYFRSDLSRLTVCKQWREYAQVALYQEFHATQRTLERILDLSLKRFEDWDSFDAVISPGHDPRIHVTDLMHAMRENWTRNLDSDLLHLATTIRQSPKLRTLRIQAASELHPRFPLLERRSYLFLSSMLVVCSSARNLTILDLDLCGTELLKDQAPVQKGYHICPIIAALLPKLHRLRLRTCTICPIALKADPQSTDLRLHTVLVNLSLSNESCLITSATHAARCVGAGRGFLQLKAYMEQQAQILVEQVVAPKIVRVLTHGLPRIEMRTFDALTGGYVSLEESAEWDDDGKVIEDKVEDEESEISDLESDEE